MKRELFFLDNFYQGARSVLNKKKIVRVDEFVVDHGNRKKIHRHVESLKVWITSTSHRMIYSCGVLLQFLFAGLQTK